MKDELLFGLLPYGAFLLFLTGFGVRLVVPGSRGSSGRLGSRLTGRSLSWRSWSWRVGFAGVLLVHLVGFLFPRGLESIHQSPRVLLTVEALGVLFGALAVVGLLLETLQPDGGLRPRSAFDTVGLTLLGVALASGLLMTLNFRGSPTWFGAVLVPYLRSILELEPRVGLIGPLPFLVRLHVLAAFLLLAAAPWTSAGSWVSWRWQVTEETA